MADLSANRMAPHQSLRVLFVDDEKPLQEGEKGPVISVSADDVTEYQQEKANGESVVPVQAGEQLTEYQALQGLLIPPGPLGQEFGHIVGSGHDCKTRSKRQWGILQRGAQL